MRRKGYYAVVETGSCDATTRTHWEEKINCGHAHKTIEAAMKCGEKNYDAKYVNGTWQASAEWHGYRVHDEDQRRVEGI